jgi:hypothetical protein
LIYLCCYFLLYYIFILSLFICLFIYSLFFISFSSFNRIKSERMLYKWWFMFRLLCKVRWNGIG